jgi:hypothetical protein
MAHVEKVKGKIVLRDDWHIEDVMEVAENMGIEISEEDAEWVLNDVADNFDANIGINWDVIEMALQNYGEEAND